MWDVLAERLEREGLVPRGLVALAGLDRDEQRALTDRPAARAATTARKEEAYAVYATWRRAHPDSSELGLDDRLDDWLEGLRRDGGLGRERDPAALVHDALEVLWHQRRHLADRSDQDFPVRPVARTELAARLLGDAHGLDDDGRLAAVVLRAARLFRPLAESAAPSRSEREDWETLGILTDRVSSTCLTLGLRTSGDGAVAQGVARYGTDQVVLHLTWRDLDEGLRFAPGQTVLVRENPRVVESAAESGLHGVDLVSTNGRPAVVVLEVLSRLRGAGANLLYHGDSDWPGIAMADEVVRRFDARPWRMSADDYLALPARLPLRGERVDPSWDPELSAAMAQRRLAVHEEAALPELTQALASATATDARLAPSQRLYR